MSQKYLLPCSCGRKLPVDLAQTGHRVRCACGVELEVPTLLGLRRLPQAEVCDQAQGAPGRPWGASQRLVLGGTVLILLGLILATWFFVTRPRIIDVAKYPPVATLPLWESLKMGVDIPLSNDEKNMFAYLEQCHRWTVAGLVVAVLGMLVLSGSLLMGGRGAAKSRPPAS